MTSLIIPTKDEKEPVLMPEENKKFLKELYLRRSYSGNEEAIRSVITAFLDKLKIPYVNFCGNILGFNHPGAPLFSAHMDMVNTERYKLKPREYEVEGEYVFTLDSKTNIRLYRDKEKKHQTSLGADDKNGIWVILTMLQMGKELNFAFCHSEEVGGTGSSQIVQDEDLAQFIEGCRYGIIIDRRNKNDIIGYDNKYCMALDDRLAAFSKNNGFTFTPVRGSVSDADRFSQLIECVNLSCGYYEPHTSSEYTNLNELWNTLQFCIKILDEFNYESVSPKRIQEFKGCKSPYSKTISTYSSYFYPKKEEVEDEKKTTTYRSSYGYYADSYNTNRATEKKTPEKETKTISGIDITGKDGTKNELESILSNYVYDALTNGAVHIGELDAFLIPLYEAQDISDSKDPKKAEDIIVWDSCLGCEGDCALTQGSIDALYTEYYNKREEKVYGFCTKCGKISDVTSTVRYLL